MKEFKPGQKVIFTMPSDVKIRDIPYMPKTKSEVVISAVFDWGIVIQDFAVDAENRVQYFHSRCFRPQFIQYADIVNISVVLLLRTEKYNGNV